MTLFIWIWSSFEVMDVNPKNPKKRLTGKQWKFLWKLLFFRIQSFWLPYLYWIPKSALTWSWRKDKCFSKYHSYFEEYRLVSVYLRVCSPDKSEWFKWRIISISYQTFEFTNFTVFCLSQLSDTVTLFSRMLCIVYFS